MLQGFDFAAHNAEVRDLWAAYVGGRPWRVPVIFGTNTRYFLLDEAANPEGVSFREYVEDPATMLRLQVQFADWSRHNIPQDLELGPPSEGWDVRVDFQNYYEAAWLGCPVVYFDGQVPDTLPILHDDDKRAILDRGLPDPYSGLMAKNWEYYQHMRRRQDEGYAYAGRPIRSVTPCGLGTDGPFTVACNLRGATEMCLDLLADPGYARDLLDFITEATINRIRAYRTALGEPIVTSRFGIADDSIASLSTATYEELVLPCHKRLMAAFADPSLEPAPPTGPLVGPQGVAQVARYNGIHLCGDATRHFALIRRELGAGSFDTGFPVDFGALRQSLGPAVQILGGPHVELLRQGPPDAIRAEVARILSSGVTEGRRFILREGNNLAPRTPLEHLSAMYEAARELGRYD